MDSLAQNFENEKALSKRISSFFRRFHIGAILRKSNAYKERGISVTSLFAYLFQLVFRNRSMYLDMRSEKAPAFQKDTIYRMKNSIHINWIRFTTLLSATVIENAIKPLTSEDRRDVFIVDDSIYERNRSKKVELLARVFDHARHRYIRGFRMLTLGWSDGVSFFPINSCLLSTENQINRLNEAKIVKKQTFGAEIREMAQGKATDVTLYLIQKAQAAGIRAKYVLFDSWFAMPKLIRSLKAMNLDTVAMIKKTDKIKFLYNGQKYSNKEIFRINKKRRGRSKYLLSVPVEICGDVNIQAKLVFVRNRNNKSDYLVLISTDISLQEHEIIQLYGKRWDIEVFFKACKSFLRLTDECRSVSYDAMCCQTALVFARYIFLALAIREDSDGRSLGPIFCLICDEISDISFDAALEKLQLFLEELAQQLSTIHFDFRIFTADFFAKLPADLVRMLNTKVLKATKC